MLLIEKVLGQSALKKKLADAYIVVSTCVCVSCMSGFILSFHWYLEAEEKVEGACCTLAKGG